MKTAKLGTVSHGTLRTEDLLSSFISTLEGLMLINGDHFAANHAERDRLCNLIGAAQDVFAEDGETIAEDKQDDAAELVTELQDALSEFAPPYAYFGAHEGDGADFGFWVNIEDVKEQVEFVSSKREDYPPAEFRGEWLHVSDHGNCTLYVREDSKTDAQGFTDREVWGVV
jgi:hypothetical protein